MVLMIETPTIPLVKEKILPLLQLRFPDITFVSKIRDDQQVKNVIKSSFVTGDAVDIVAFWPHQMRYFIDDGMALDLTPYLEADPDWWDSWLPGILEDGRFEGKQYALPYRISYPLFLVNRDIARQAELVLKDQWTWDEFIQACEQIKTRCSDAVYPLGINAIWACWFIRNGLMQIWDTDNELEAFTRGEIPFTNPRIKQAFEKVKALYDNKYLYPGVGALTATYDQTFSAFARGKIAFLANVNGNAAAARNAIAPGGFEVGVMSWPAMGKDYLLGGSDGYFIPSNTKHPEKAVEVLKYLTGSEILDLNAEEGRILTFKNIASSHPDYALYSRDAGKVRSREIVNFSAELNDYIIYNIPAYYILYGDKAVEELEVLRSTVNP
jgi:ABC-type glycerol-3-phosphate transport system substrate-binding protein